MNEGTTRRGFLQRILMGAGAIAAAGAGLAPVLGSRAAMLNELAQHLIRVGYNVCRYSKF